MRKYPRKNHKRSKLSETEISKYLGIFRQKFSKIYILYWEHVAECFMTVLGLFGLEIPKSIHPGILRMYTAYERPKHKKLESDSI
jgi:hypothetical protein